MRATLMYENGVSLAYETLAGELPVSLRDYFAAAALTGILANADMVRCLLEDWQQGYQNIDSVLPLAASQKAFEIADATLRKRNK